MWHVIFNWPWATIWTAISAIFTAAAVGVASWAMFRWRKQDELRVKLDFKKAVCEYAYILTQMPGSLKNTASTKEDDLKKIFGKCTFEWMACEGLLKTNITVSQNWTSLVIDHSEYLLGNINSDVLMKHCLEIMDEKFVFN
ncbi:TPA: hypothetical protein R4045_001084 [Citrobacter freundii]|nr:hypothetical protein [Citrobacter freundii]